MSDFYIGPFVVCTESTPLTISKAIKTCSNLECVQHKNKINTKFCSECGEEVKALNIEEVVNRSIEIGALDYIECKELQDYLKEHDIYEQELHSVGNLKNKVVWIENSCEPNFGTYAESLVEINKKLLDKNQVKLEKFKARYKPIFDILVRHYGAKAFSYRFGFGIV